MLFGKLPGHGDFIARGLDAGERDILDRWLSDTMVDAQEVHGGAFPDRFDQAPPWRFTLREGEGWSGGALIPSIDAAGRRFPFFAGLAGLTYEEAAHAAEATEALLYQALTERWYADGLVTALDAIDGAAAGDMPAAGWWTLGSAAGENGIGFAPAHVPDRRPATLARLMLTATRA